MLSLILVCVALILVGAILYPTSRNLAGVVVLLAVIALIAAAARWSPL